MCHGQLSGHVFKSVETSLCSSLFWMFIITAGEAEDVCILSIWSCEFDKEMYTSLHVQVRGVINTNQQKDQQQDYPGLLAGRAPDATLI